MISMKRLAGGAALTVLALASASAVYAQETTAALGGRVTDPAGAPLASVTVTITHVPSGTTVTTMTNADGYYNARSLRVGGPYTVVVRDPAFQGKTVQVDQIGAGAPTILDVPLAAADASVSEVIVTAAQSGVRTLVTGPRSTFSAQDIESLPSFSRDLKDLVRMNPFVTLDPTNNNALIIAGSNNRVNTIYIDGVKQADDFGLNGNGYPSQRSPISTDVVKQVSVEVAPYDVQYGAFQGGVVNIVTKSGDNEFHGSLYGEYDSEKFAGRRYQPIDRTRAKVKVANFEDKVYGFTLGGPIIKDRLFFFGGYEKGEFAQASDAFGPSDSSAPNKVPGITVAQVTQIQNTLKSVYGFDPLGYGATLPPQEDKKYFFKLDANITDNQRAVFSYQREENTSTFNGGSNSVSATSGTLALLSNYYSKPETLEVYGGQLFSQWTENFSTDIEYSHKEVSSIRAPLAGSDFANFQIKLGNQSVTLGPDISSQANILNNTNEAFKLRAIYRLGNHVFSAGVEHEKLDVFNEFVQRANGAYVFDASCGAGVGIPSTNTAALAAAALTNLQNRQACTLTYSNAANNQKASGAANWDSITNTLYAQDEYSLTPDLTIRIGFRGEFFDSNTAPTANARFLRQYGFANTATFKGIHVIMPRFGFNWRPDERTVITGGVGLFSGGSPNVWLSNSFSNTGNLLGSVSCSTAATSVCSSAVSNVDGLHVAQSALTANTNSANLGTGIVNAVDPNFKAPSVWKYSISAARYFNVPYIGDDWRVHADFLYQKTNYGITWRDLYADANPGPRAPDGRPTYLASRSAATLSNPPTAAFYDLLLTNTRKGGGTVYALGFGKKWTEGLADGLDFDVTYTRTDMKETNPGTSSVALSNYSQWAISDRDNAETATSNYQIKYQTKAAVGYSHAFFGDNKTSARFFIQRRAGLPFSYTFDSATNSLNGGLTASGQIEQMFGETEDVAFRDTQLFYVPKADSSGAITQTSDPIAHFGSAADAAAMDAFVKRTGLDKYAGKIAPRNAFKSRDITTMDVRLEQELPAFFPGGAKLKAYVDLINVGNMINSKWGVLEQYGFPYAVRVSTAINCQPAVLAGQAAGVAAKCLAGPGNYYQYSAPTNTLPTLSNSNQSSTWYVKFGLKYQF